MGGIVGVTVNVDGWTLHLLPYTSADANLDGRLASADAVAVVDGGDFLAWQRGLGTPMPLADLTAGDNDNDTDVDDDDLVVWQNSYGTSPLAAQAAGLAEPDTLAIPAAISGTEESVSLAGVAQFFESDQENQDEDKPIEKSYFILSDLLR